MTLPETQDGTAMLATRMINEIFEILKEYDNDTIISYDTIERGCGYLNLYDGRKAQITVKINAEEETWIQEQGDE